MPSHTRAAVISIYKATGDEEYNSVPEKEILFRQPFHDFGLAFRFSFQKSYVAPFGTCDLSIENISTEMTDAFSFDFTTYMRRPLVEIRAGYSKEQIADVSQLSIDKLKGDLPLVYTGHPYYLIDQKVSGGRVLTVQLSDVSTAFLQGKNARVCDWFRKGMLITDLIEALLGQIPGLKYDVTGLKAHSRASTISLPNDVFYNNLNILGNVINSLKKEYQLWTTTDAKGTLIFWPADRTPSTGTTTVVDSESGMIENPARVNWTHWNVKTLFQRPKLFYPGEWMIIESESFTRQKQSGSKYVTGVVIEGDYNWDDENAMCSYVIAPEGEPVSQYPVITI